MDNVVELFNATMLLGDKVSGSWQIFVAVNTAIFGWLVSKNSKHRVSARIVASIAYFVFAFSVYKSLEVSYAFYNAAINDVTAVANEAKGFILNSALQKEIIALGKENFWRVYWQYIYWVSAIGVALFIYMDILSRHKADA